jgi:hypothetical protein
MFILVEVKHPGGDFSEDRIFRGFELGQFDEISESSISHVLKVHVTQSEQ